MIRWYSSSEAVESVAEEAGKLTFARLAAALDDVGGDRLRRAGDLVAQRGILLPPDARGGAVGLQCQGVRLAPHQQLLEVGHGRRL